MLYSRLETKLDSKIDYYLKNKILLSDIESNHKLIRSKLNIDNQNFKLKSSMVKKLFLLSDKIYFKNLIQDKLKQINYTIDFKITNKFKTTAGCCAYCQNKIDLVFSKYVLNKIANDKFQSIKINNIICYDMTDVLICLMEHEITHLILFLYTRYKNDVKSGHNEQFKNLVYNMYSHTKITHDLLAGDLQIKENCKNKAINELKIGMKIQSKNYNGIVIKIKTKGILYLTETKLRICAFNDYKIIDNSYREYQNKILDLRKKLKPNIKIKTFHHSGILIEVIDDKVYYKDNSDEKIYWSLIYLISLDN